MKTNLTKIHDSLWVPHDFEKNHSYFADPEKKGRYTGVTTVLNVIAKPQLINWSAKMTAEWIRENCNKEITPSQTEHPYFVYEHDLAEAVKAHTKKKEAGGEKGKDLHSEVEMYIKKCIQEADGLAMGDIAITSGGMMSFVNWSRTNKIRFLSSETPIYSREWWVAGTPDFTFEKDGKRYVGDLKTYKKIWGRTPHFQTAAYMKMSVEMGEKPYDGTCIVNINKETNELTESWSYDTAGDQKAFEAALTLYRRLENF